LAFGAAAGAGCCARTPGATSEATNAVAANQAKTRPRRWTDAAKIRKFIAGALLNRDIETAVASAHALRTRPPGNNW
jgi:hypothetical protein